MIRQEKARYYKNLIQESQSTPQKLWRAIKKCLSNKKPCEQKPKSLRINSTITSDKREIANGFNTFFTNVAATLRATLPKVYEAISAKISCNGNDISTMDIKFVFRPATKGEALKVISSLKRSKSPGLDNIPPGIVKDATHEIIQPLLHILNLSLSTSTIPSELKVARCVPIYKGGNAKDLDNYRPISILPVFSKILEKVVYFQLYHYLENNKLLSPYQFGFRKNHSTKSSVVHLTDTVRKSMDKGKLTRALFIDLRKAFDTVDHQSLLSKLPYYGIEITELRWIHDCLSHRSQIVNYEGEKSKEEQILFGVPRGSILGPSNTF